MKRIRISFCIACFSFFILCQSEFSPAGSARPTVMALRRNVLIFHSGALGDFILSWPLALAFGRLFAQSRIFYVTQRQKGQLAEKALRIESVDAETGGGAGAVWGG